MAYKNENSRVISSEDLPIHIKNEHESHGAMCNKEKSDAVILDCSRKYVVPMNVFI